MEFTFGLKFAFKKPENILRLTPKHYYLLSSDQRDLLNRYIAKHSAIKGGMFGVISEDIVQQ